MLGFDSNGEVVKKKRRGDVGKAPSGRNFVHPPNDDDVKSAFGLIGVEDPRVKRMEKGKARRVYENEDYSVDKQVRFTKV